MHILINKFKGRSLLQIVQGILKRLTSSFIYIDRLNMLRFDGLPYPSERMLRGVGKVREATPEDINGMSLCEGKPEKLFNDRFLRGDIAVVGLVDDIIVGYEWFCPTEIFNDELINFQVVIKPNEIFAYDSYISQEHRLKGLFPKFRKFLAEKMQEIDKSSVVTLVDHNNKLAKRTFLRFGFKVIYDTWILKIGSKRFFFKVEN